MIDINQYRAAIGGFRCRGSPQEDTIDEDLEEIEKIRKNIKKMETNKKKNQQNQENKKKNEQNKENYQKNEQNQSKKTEEGKWSGPQEKQENQPKQKDDQSHLIVTDIIKEVLDKMNNNEQVIDAELVKSGVETNPGPGTASQSIAAEILEAVHRCHLPFTLDRLTPADGNCYSHAVMAQLERKEVYQAVKREVKMTVKSKNPLMLKAKVATFITNSCHPNVLQFKQSYIEKVQPVDNITWDRYWVQAKKSGIWADAISVQATAWFCKTDIIIVSTSSTPTRPYITISGNIDNEDMATISPPLILGTKSNSHYQSLLPQGQIFEGRQEVVDVFNLIDQERQGSTEESQEEQKSSGKNIPSKTNETGNNETGTNVPSTRTEMEAKVTSEDSTSAEKIDKVEVEDAVTFNHLGTKYNMKVEQDGKLNCSFCNKKIMHIKQHFAKCNILDNKVLNQLCKEVTLIRNRISKRKWKTKLDDEGKKAVNFKIKEHKKISRTKLDDEKIKAQHIKQTQARKEKLGDELCKEKNKEHVRKCRAKLDEETRKAQNRKYKQEKKDKEKCYDATMRRKKFLEAVVRGPIFLCSCCHQMLYKKSVTIITEKMREKIGNKSEEVYNTYLRFETISVEGKYYLCSTCRYTLSAGKIPAMAVANGLNLTPIPKKCQLSELENNIIAQNINFQKIVLLQKSRWKAGKGRIVSVPVGPNDVMNSVKQLPRLPSEAGLVPIKLKRKKQYQGHEKNEMISPEKIFQALRLLRGAGHPFYQFYDSQENYMARCKEKDKRGYMMLTGEGNDNIEDDLEVMPVEDSNINITDEVPNHDDEDLETVLENESEDIQNDPIRRQHFNYQENSYLVNAHPEIFLDEEGNQVADLNFAPAEGKIPNNFLDQKNWDIKSWPILHPDGKFGLDHPRKVKLTKQKYFQQRILNKDKRFAETAGYIFAATSLVESERLRSNANLSTYKGNKITDSGGQVSYEVKDPFTVFDKIKNTPKYWQTVKFDMIAKLENIGPFHWFFTLSCGDLRWSSNFTTYLEEKDVTIIYDVDKNGHENIMVRKKESKMTLEQYLKEETDISKHEMIRKNVLLATRNFQHRVEEFKKNIIFGNNNPMKIRHISYRVEFQVVIHPKEGCLPKVSY